MNEEPLDLEYDQPWSGRLIGLVPLSVTLPMLVASGVLLWNGFYFLTALMMPPSLALSGLLIFLVFGRSGATLDRESQSLTRWWRLGPARYRRVSALPAATEVALLCEAERRGLRNDWCVSIELRGPEPARLYSRRVVVGRADDIRFSETERRVLFDGALELANRVGSYLSIPVRNEVPSHMSRAPIKA